MTALEGKLVITIEQAVAAPFCTSRLADAGARVIKVERPEGDFARGYDKAAKMAHEAHVQNISLKEACLQLGYLDAKAFDKAVDPKKMTRPNDEPS